MRPDDYNFIMATWLIGLYYGNDWFTKIDKDVYMKHYHDIVDRVLKKPTLISNLAVLKEDDSVILGYAIYEPKILHWVYVKEAWREIGIAKQIVPEDTEVTTHLTKLGFSLRKHIKFNPFQL